MFMWRIARRSASPPERRVLSAAAGRFGGRSGHRQRSRCSGWPPRGICRPGVAYTNRYTTACRRAGYWFLTHIMRLAEQPSASAWLLPANPSRHEVGDRCNRAHHVARRTRNCLRCQIIGSYDCVPLTRETRGEASWSGKCWHLRRDGAEPVGFRLRADTNGTDGPGHARARQIVRCVPSDQVSCKGFAEQSVAGQAQAANNQAVGAAASVRPCWCRTWGGHWRRARCGDRCRQRRRVGTAIGAQGSSNAQMSIQQQYDNAFAQCMYAKGDMVPGYGPMMSQSPPPPPSGPDPA